MFYSGALPDFYIRSERKSTSHEHAAGTKHRVQSGRDPQRVQRLEKSRNHQGCAWCGRRGIIKFARGAGGAELCKDPSEITLHMIYNALEPDGLSSLIGIHPCEGRKCPVAQNIRLVLQGPYQAIEDSIRHTMEGITLDSMIQDFHSRLSGTV